MDGGNDSPLEIFRRDVSRCRARRIRGRQKAPTKKEVTLQLDERVIEHFKATGDGWQSRMNEALKKAAGL